MQQDYNKIVTKSNNVESEVFVVSFLTEKELCRKLRVSRVFLYHCRQKGMPFIRVGSRCIRYELDSVVDWINKSNTRYTYEYWV